jgi:hypothetical protein
LQGDIVEIKDIVGGKSIYIGRKQYSITKLVVFNRNISCCDVSKADKSVDESLRSIKNT